MIRNPKFYLRKGVSPTIVFLHGWGMSASSFDCIKENLDERYQILTLDFFGFGESEIPPIYYDTYEYAYSVFLLLKKLKIENIILIGHSFGGRISIILSSIFNIKIYKMILTSSAGINFFSLKKYLKVKSYKFIKRLSNKFPKLKNIKSKYGSDDYKKLSPIIQSVFVKIVNQDLRFLLKKIKIDTLLIWGKKDKITPFRIAKVLNKLICQSKIVCFKKCNHYIFIENYILFLKVLNAFIYHTHDNLCNVADTNQY